MSFESFGVCNDQSIQDLMRAMLLLLNATESGTGETKVLVERHRSVSHPDFLVIKTQDRTYEIQVYENANRFAGFDECKRLEALKIV